MDKCQLAQMALAAFVVAANVSAAIQADESLQAVKGVFLAAHGCAHCGGHSADREISYNATMDSAATSPYNTNANTYSPGSNVTVPSAQTGSLSPSSTTQGYNPGSNSPGTSTSATGATFGNRGTTSDSSYNINNANNSMYRANATSGTGNSTGYYNTNQSYNPPGYGTDSYRSSTFNVGAQASTSPSTIGTQPYSEMYSGTVQPGNYDARRDYDYSRSTVAVTPSNTILTEDQLVAILSPQGKAIYLSLDSEGRNLALQLASQDSYRDKDLAVKEAQRRINEKRGLMSR